MSKHWIVKLQAHGEHERYSHIESDEKPHSGMHALISEVDSGPADTAGQAWEMWHLKRGNLKPQK